MDTVLDFSRIPVNDV